MATRPTPAPSLTAKGVVMSVGRWMFGSPGFLFGLIIGRARRRLLRLAPSHPPGSGPQVPGRTAVDGPAVVDLGAIGVAARCLARIGAGAGGHRIGPSPAGRPGDPRRNRGHRHRHRPRHVVLHARRGLSAPQPHGGGQALDRGLRQPAVGRPDRPRRVRRGGGHVGALDLGLLPAGQPVWTTSRSASCPRGERPSAAPSAPP